MIFFGRSTVAANTNNFALDLLTGAGQSDSDEFTFNDVLSGLFLTKIVTDEYLMHKLEPQLRNEVQRFLTTVDPNSDHTFARSWSQQVAQGLLHRVVSSLTDTTYLKAIPNLLKGEAILGNFSGALLTPNHIPYELLESKEPYRVSRAMGYRFLKIGPKATGKWRNFFKVMALSGFETMTDIIAAGTTVAVSNDLFLAKMYNSKYAVAHGNEDTSDRTSTAFSSEFVTDGSFFGLTKILMFKTTSRLISSMVHSFKDALLPNQQLTGYYTIKDGVIYHVEHDTRTERHRRIEAVLSQVEYISPARAQDYIDTGLLRLGKVIAPVQSRGKQVLEMARNYGNFVVEEIIDYYIGSMLSLTYKKVDYYTGDRISRHAFGENRQPFERNFSQNILSDGVRETKKAVIGVIKNAVIKPLFRFLWLKTTGKSWGTPVGYIRGVSLINGDFRYLEVVEDAITP